jgi:hypothetical protein
MRKRDWPKPAESNNSTGSEFRGERLRLAQQLRHLIGGQLVGLHAGLVEGVNLHEYETRQPSRDEFAGITTSLVFVEHDNHLAVTIGVSPDQFLVRGGQVAAHEGNDPPHPVLPEVHHIEESLNDHQWPVDGFRDGPVKVEKFQRLFESLGKLIFLRHIIAQRPSGIGHELAGRIMDGDGDAILLNMPGPNAPGSQATRAVRRMKRWGIIPRRSTLPTQSAPKSRWHPSRITRRWRRKRCSGLNLRVRIPHCHKRGLNHRFLDGCRRHRG